MWPTAAWPSRRTSRTSRTCPWCSRTTRCGRTSGELPVQVRGRGVGDTVDVELAGPAHRGRGYEHAIDIPGHGRLTSVFSDTWADHGEHVRLRLNPRG